MNYKKILIQYKYTSFAILLLVLLLSIFVIIVLYGAQQGGRGLTTREALYASTVFGNDITLGDVHLTFGSVYSMFAPVTLGNTIHIKSSWLKLPTDGDLTYSAVSRHTLIHELVHVHQYQHGGWSYLVKSLSAQFIALMTSHDRNEAYVWEDRIADNKTYASWNPEEQAQAVSDYVYYRETGVGYSSDPRGFTPKLACFIPILIQRFCVIQ